MYSDRLFALKTLPVFTDMLAKDFKARMKSEMSCNYCILEQVWYDE